MTITEEQVEQLGQLADSCDNFLHSAQLPLPTHIHLEGLTGGLTKVRDELRKLHEELSDDRYDDRYLGHELAEVQDLAQDSD